MYVFPFPLCLWVPSSVRFVDQWILDKSRTLALEQSFFDSLALYFRLEPVVAAAGRGPTEDEAKIYSCRRWRVTSEWAVPEEKDVMNGSKEVKRGQGGFGLMEEMLGAIEWD